MGKKSERVCLQFSTTHTAMMVGCVCGDIFQSSGKPEKVSREHDAWRAEHKGCSTKKREGVKTFWMSFCDSARPKGKQFLGACVIDVTAAEADDAAILVLLRFPFAQPNAEWIAAATTNAHRLGCNPGGEIATMEITADHPMLARYQRGVLMDRATIERIDAEIEAQAAVGDQSGS